MKILKGIGAVLAGIIFIIATHSLTDLVLESLGIFPSPDAGLHTTWMLVTATIYRSIFNVGGGYVTAALAPDRPMLHAIILGAIGTAVAAAAAVFVIPMNLSPAWYPIGLAVLALPCTWLGGKLKIK
jgi:hypothetical protein